MDRDYLLGTDDAELRRLGFQHQVWAAEASRGWERGGFAPGMHLLDVGCGPGFATLDMARLVGPRGRVTGVDVSARFVAHLQAEAAVREVHNVSAEVQDVERLGLPPGLFDGAYSRWVFCFVSSPAEVVRGVAATLRPGARFVIQDYSHYQGIHFAPGGAAFDDVISAVMRWWRESGGDPGVGSVLPGALLDAGFEIESLRPISRIARPGTALWEWPRRFFDHFLPQLVRAGYLSEAEREAFDAGWAELSGSPAAYFCTPPMVEIVAVRR